MLCQKIGEPFHEPEQGVRRGNMTRHLPDDQGAGRLGRVIVLRARVVTHRFVDEVIDGAIEVVGHLLERLPEDVPAVEMAHRLLALVHPVFFAFYSARRLESTAT